MPFYCKKTKSAASNMMYSTKIKIAADGQRIVKSLHSIQERHLVADPELPSLEERASMSTNKDLYELSKQLAADSDAKPSGSNVFLVPADQRSVKSVHSIQERHLTADPELPTLEEEANMSSNFHLNKLSKLAKQTEVQPRESEVYFDDAPQQKGNSHTKINTNGNSGTDGGQDEPKKKQLKKRKNRTSSVAETLNEDNINDYIREQVQLVTVQQLAEIRCPCDPKHNAATVLPRTKEQVLVDNSNDPMSDTGIPQSLNSNSDESSDKSSNSCTDRITKKINNCYFRSLLLHLCLLAILVYIAMFDLNEYVVEQKRYWAKMRSSALPMKCFYYLMHVLKIPIF